MWLCSTSTEVPSSSPSCTMQPHISKHFSIKGYDDHDQFAFVPHSIGSWVRLGSEVGWEKFCECVGAWMYMVSVWVHGCTWVSVCGWMYMDECVWMDVHGECVWMDVHGECVWMDVHGECVWMDV